MAWSPLLMTLIQAAPSAILAVFPIDDGTGRLAPKTLAQLGDYFDGKLAASGLYSLVPRPELEAALRQKKADSYQECYDQACQIEIGREVAAQKVCQVKIVQLGDLCGVTATIYDLRSGASDIAATKKAACDENSIVDALESVGAALAREKEAPTTVPQAAAAKLPRRPPPDPVLWVSASPPSAEILLDDAVLGDGTVRRALPAGSEHRLLVRAEGRITHTSTVRLARDEHRVVELDWTEAGLAARVEFATLSVAPFTTLGGTRGMAFWASLLPLRAGSFVWTPFEAFVGFGTGRSSIEYSSGASAAFNATGGLASAIDTRLGYRLNLSSRSTLEVGLGAGALILAGTNGWVDDIVSPALVPTVRYQFIPEGSLGFGLGFRLLAPLIRGCDPHSAEADAAALIRCQRKDATMIQVEGTIGVY